MKKIFISFLLCLSILLVKPTDTRAYFNVSFKYGSKGDGVMELQDFLQDHSYYTGKIDGKYGLGTRKGVIAFQTDNELKPDGYFGTSSRLKASDILTAELQVSNDAEQQDTGTITPAVVLMQGCTSTSGFSTSTGHPCDGSTPSPVTDTTTQSKIDALTSQVQALTQAQQQVVQNTQQIATNTTPVVTPIVVPQVQSVPVVVAPVPTYSLTVNSRVNNTTTQFIKENAQNGDFEDIAVVYKIPAKSPSGTDNLNPTIWYAGDHKGRLSDCPSLKQGWLDNSKMDFPYTCPDSTPDYYYVARANIDAFQRKTPFSLMDGSDGDFGQPFPIGTTVYYYKTIDHTTGTVFEYTAQ